MALCAASLASAQPPAPADPYAEGRAVIAGLQEIVTPNGVDERFTVTLGGARQMVRARGADRANPILLFVHGGPGAAEIPYIWSFQRPWEDFFTVVQWDQRGAGLSYPLENPETIAPTLTLDRYVDDTIELIELLRARYGQRKVILVGHSWGSFVGLHVAERRPDLLHAYVGMGQLIDWRENERVQMEWTLAEARRRGDAAAIAELEAIQPYPGPGAIDPVSIDVLRKWSRSYGALAAYRDDMQFYFSLPRLSPDYTPADRASANEGSALSIRTVIPQMAGESAADITRLEVPVILILGRHDYTVPASIAAEWLDRLEAPSKELVWLEHSAHLMMVEEPGRTLAALLEHARPIAMAVEEELAE